MPKKITDYTLEIGWSGTKVTQGIDKMTKKLNKAVTAANKLATATNKIAAANKKINAASVKSVKKIGRNIGPTQIGQQLPKKGGVPFGAGRSAELAKKQGKQIKAQISLNDKVARQWDTAENKIRSVRKAILGMDMAAKNSKGNKVLLEQSISKLQAYQTQLKSTTVTTQAHLLAQKRSYTSLTHSINDNLMAVRASGNSYSLWANLVKAARAAAKSFGLALVAMALTKATSILYENGKAWENLRIQMQASFGSAEAGAERMDFLINKSKELGVDVKILADGYAKIGVAARMSNIPMEDSEEIFLAAAEASRAFGLSTDDTQGVMRAFSQMMGKNQVMMEELKLQLGDRMPSAMGIFAKSMGLTVSGLMDQVKAGKVGNKELVNFAKFLRADIRASGAYRKSLESVEASQTRFNTALSQAGDAFFSGSLKKGVAEFFNMFATFFSSTKDFWTFLGEIIGWVLRFGVQVLRMVLFPIQIVLQTIGRLWKWIFDHAMTDKKDIKNMSLLGKGVKYIYLLFVDIMNILDWIGANLDNIFDAPDWVKKLGESLKGDNSSIEEIIAGKAKPTIKKTVGGEETAFTTLRKAAVGKKSEFEAVKAYQKRMQEKAAKIRKERPLDASKKPLIVEGDLNVSIDAATKTPKEAVAYLHKFTEDMLDSALPTLVG